MKMKNESIEHMKEQMADIEVERMAIALEYENVRDDMDQKNMMVKEMKRRMEDLISERQAVNMEHNKIRE